MNYLIESKYSNKTYCWNYCSFQWTISYSDDSLIREINRKLQPYFSKDLKSVPDPDPFLTATTFRMRIGCFVGRRIALIKNYRSVITACETFLSRLWIWIRPIKDREEFVHSIIYNRYFSFWIIFTHSWFPLNYYPIYYSISTFLYLFNMHISKLIDLSQFSNVFISSLIQKKVERYSVTMILSSQIKKSTYNSLRTEFPHMVPKHSWNEHHERSLLSIMRSNPHFIHECSLKMAYLILQIISVWMYTSKTERCCYC